VIVVEGEPEPVDALPPASTGVVAPLQLPAAADLEVAGNVRTTMAAATARTTAFAGRNLIG
jgi:hypothetical protein